MDRSLSIAEDLNLDVTGARDETLEVKAPVPERGARLSACLRDLSLELRGDSITRMPRPPPPAAALIIRG